MMMINYYYFFFLRKGTWYTLEKGGRKGGGGRKVAFRPHCKMKRLQASFSSSDGPRGGSTGSGWQRPALLAPAAGWAISPTACRAPGGDGQGAHGVGGRAGGGEGCPADQVPTLSQRATADGCALASGVPSVIGGVEQVGFQSPLCVFQSWQLQSRVHEWGSSRLPELEELDVLTGTSTTPPHWKASETNRGRLCQVILLWNRREGYAAASFPLDDSGLPQADGLRAVPPRENNNSPRCLGLGRRRYRRPQL